VFAGDLTKLLLRRSTDIAGGVFPVAVRYKGGPYGERGAWGAHRSAPRVPYLNTANWRRGEAEVWCSVTARARGRQRGPKLLSREKLVRVVLQLGVGGAKAEAVLVRLSTTRCSGMADGSTEWGAPGHQEGRKGGQGGA
jgi:hypothetical protein